MPPNISLRDSIRWLPGLPSEPTTTLVLTSAQNRFVDIRILRPTDETAKSSSSSEEGEPQTSPTSTEPLSPNKTESTSTSPFPPFSPNAPSEPTSNVPEHEDILPFSRLDWAFAGTSHSSLIPDSPAHDDGNDAHAEAEERLPPEVKIFSTWRHWVDSRHADTSSVVDEGIMYALEDGRTLERGKMVNPDTGEKTAYEEIWMDVEAVEIAGEEEMEGRVCVVLVLDQEREEDGLFARGMIVRVGQFVQGVVRVGEKSFCLERWEVLQGKWRRVVRMGDLWLPCGAAMEAEKVVLGGEVRLKEMKWKVVELSCF